MSNTFAPEEASVAGIHAAMRDGSLTATQLVAGCLARIEAYERGAPRLQALLAVHPHALDEAARLDAAFARDPGTVGPLHGIPVIVKDNFETQDLPTTGGSVALKDWLPARDAFVVGRLRQAGAIVLAKANLQEFARGGVSVSSLGGQVRNPYDLTRSAGGSSGGTGAAIAAGFGVLGLGSDTGQSIRSPASACSLVGVRPTRGLVSRAGLMPNSFLQDEAGPITRTAEDAARVLDVIAGFDPRDPVTGLGVGRKPASHLAALDDHALRGARIGVLHDLFGRESRHVPVNAVMDQVAHTLRAQGATLVPLALEGLDALLAEVSTDRWEARAACERYFAGLGPGAPVRSFRELVERRGAPPAIQQALEAELAIEDGLTHPTYLARLANRDRLRVLVAATMAQHRLDALLYPLQRILVVPLGEPEQPERNGALSHGTGFPAVTFPAGFSAPTSSAPAGRARGCRTARHRFQRAAPAGAGARLRASRARAAAAAQHAALAARRAVSNPPAGTSHSADGQALRRC
ncbi:MAG TPA: amidase family protein [Ramlibacter sp.]|jgi:Asp-tRNA(Asn)/Glu-tRNA(Gln) amidotransferase A subunit family amidase|nr:amidase family protein [Ramlibacter sp.]